MTYKAQPTGNILHSTYSTSVEYEYRGHTYYVAFPNSITYCCTEPYIQHQDAQARIDEIVSRPKKEYKYEDSAEYGFDLFWDYVNGDDRVDIKWR